MKRIVIILVLTIFSSAQTVSLYLNDIISSPTDNVTINVRVKDFTNVSSTQFTLKWPSELYQYSSTSNYAFASLTSANFGTIQVDSGYLTFAWFNQSGSTNSLANDAILFSLNLIAKQAYGSGSVEITTNPTPIEIAGSSVFQHQIYNGTLNNLDSGLETILINLEQKEISASSAISVTVKDFTTVTSFQYALKWDTNFVKINGVSNFAFADLSAANFVLSADHLIVYWYDQQGLSESLVDAGKLFDITVVNNSNQPIVVSNISLSDAYLTSEISKNFSAVSLAQNNLNIFNNVPNPPQNLTASAGDKQVTLNWQAYAGSNFQSYKIYGGLSPNPTSQVAVITTKATTSQVITNLLNNTFYYYRMTVINTNLIESNYSNEVSIKPIDSTSPASPTNLSVSPLDASVQLLWRKSSSLDVQKYYIYSGTSANPSNLVDSTGSRTDTTKTVTGLINETTYFFRVTASDNSANESAFSNEVSTTPLVLNFDQETSIYQNPVLLNFITVSVSSTHLLISTPTVTINASPIIMTATGSSSKNFSGQFQFSSSGSFSLQTDLEDVNGTVLSGTRDLNVTMAKARTKLIAASENIQLSLQDGLITDGFVLIEEYPGENLYRINSINRPISEFEIKIYFDKTDFPKSDKLFIQFLRNGKWYNLYTQVTDDNKLIAHTDEFGDFRIYYDTDFIGNNIIPKQFELSQNYPNPFNPVTTIRFDLPNDGLVKIVIYNALGQLIKTLLNDFKRASSSYEVIWDATNELNQRVSSGIYYYTIVSSDFLQTKKMVLIK